MSIGNLGGCASTLPEIMQENRLQQTNSPIDNTLRSTEIIKTSGLDVEPSSINSNNIEVLHTKTVTAIEPISSSTIESTLASNKNTTNNYNTNSIKFVI